MSWVQTYTGRKFDVLNPRAEDVDWNDIATALSMQCRFNGHTSRKVAGVAKEPRFYSVAQHCVVMSRIVHPSTALYALLHDAAEAYLGDMPAPVKALVPRFKQIEDAVLLAIYEAAGVEPPHPDLENHVLFFDLCMLATERERMMDEPPEPWAIDGCEEIEVLDEPLELETPGCFAGKYLYELKRLGVSVEGSE